MVLREDDHVAIADQPSLQCGKAATCFMLNTKNSDVAARDLSEPSVKSPPLAKPSIHSSTFTGPFGLNVVPVVHGELLTKWRGVEADIRAESEVLARCLDGTEFCPSAARKFLAIIAEGRARTGRARIGEPPVRSRRIKNPRVQHRKS